MPSRNHRSISVRGETYNALADRAEADGVSQRALADDIITTALDKLPTPQPVSGIPRGLTNGERDVLNTLPGEPSWSDTEAVIKAVKRKVDRVGAMYALDTLRERGLVRRRRMPGSSAGQWQRIGDEP
jgi:hypothetical protein